MKMSIEDFMDFVYDMLSEDPDNIRANKIIDAACNLMEDKWILCSERMPEEHEWIGTKRFATTKSGKVLITLVDNLVIDGNKKPYYGDRVVVCDHFENGEMRTKFHGTPIAWMPLPEPYKNDAIKREER